MKTLGWLVLILVAALVLLALLPGPIESERYTPGPRRAPFPPNDLLARSCERISVGEIAHADKLLVDGRGRVYAGDDRGRIHVLVPEPDGRYRREILAEPGGYPFELVFGPDGLLYGADHEGSHFRIEASGRITRLPTLRGLATGTAGLDVATDGTLYYGAHPASTPDELVFMEMLAAHRASELRSYDPATGEERVLAEGLFRPVGVELSTAEDFVAVAEFFANRVTRVWLSGPRAGEVDRLVEDLPGVVDGLGSDGAGTFYLTMPGYDPPILGWLHERPFVKDQLAKLLPVLMRIGATPAGGPGLVLALDEEGQILRTFQDPAGSVVDTITAAEHHEGVLFVGSITGDWIARCPIEGV